MSDLGLMCLIALERPSRLDPDAVLEALSLVAPRSDLLVERYEADDGESGLSVHIDGQGFAIAALSGQMPSEISETAERMSAFWAERREALAAHEGFLAVSAHEAARGYGLTRAQAVALTRLSAALAKTVSVLGLIWTSAGVGISAARLEKIPEQIQSGQWPIDMWIGFQLLGTHHDGMPLIGARSRGAVPFFGAELEVAPLPTADRAEPLRLLMNFANHLMAHGPHLRHGQPIHVMGERPMQVVLISAPRAADGSPGTAIMRLVPARAKAE